MKICIPVREKTFNQAKNVLKKVQNHADFLEIWLDSFMRSEGTQHFTSYNNQIKNLIKLAKKPVLAVCRGAIEKGSFKGTEAQRVEVLKNAIECGVAFVDIGIETSKKYIREMRILCKKLGAKLIISWHSWDKKMPSERVMQKYIVSAKKLGADIVKIAVNVSKFSDNVILFELTKWARAKKINAIVIGMGEKGKISRIGCPLLGSFLTYVALDEKSKTADGQFTISEYQSIVGKPQ